MTETLLIIQIITIIWLVRITMNYNRLKVSYHSFMKGKDGKTLEDSIFERFKEIEKAGEISNKNKEDISELRKKCRRHYQKFGIVKYDAFPKTEGNLSFALTMLDEDNNGWILNALHSEESCYNYIKEIVNGESYIALSEEEKESLEKAMFQELYDLKRVYKESDAKTNLDGINKK